VAQNSFLFVGFMKALHTWARPPTPPRQGLLFHESSGWVGFPYVPCDF
jgi:hypothetical protein